MRNFDRIKSMSLDELASFFADLASRGDGIIEMADSYICRRCKRGNGGHCPVDIDTEPCLYDAANTQTMKYWLEGEVES